MKVEILYLAGCPHVAEARQAVKQALQQAGAPAEIRDVLVSEQSVAQTEGFAGSPTILINGRDVEPAQARGFSCRIYADGKGYPSAETVQQAVERARAERETQ